MVSMSRDDPLQQRHEVADVAGVGLEVLPHPGAQAGGLADVEDLAAPILHQ